MREERRRGRGRSEKKRGREREGEERMEGRRKKELEGENKENADNEKITVARNIHPTCSVHHSIWNEVETEAHGTACPASHYPQP